MFKFATVLAVVAFISASLLAANTTRYFKEDHHTGADYIALASDGTYTVTAREHMGCLVEETGLWSKSGTSIMFSPKKAGVPSYQLEEVTYKRHTFLSQQGDSGPTIAVPIKEIEQDLDKNPKALPSYVFFEISATVYQRETKQTYPFRTRPDLPTADCN
jgi:hypothetical protein